MVRIVGEDENGQLITEHNYDAFVKRSEDRVAAAGGAEDIAFDAAGVQKVIDEIEDIIRHEVTRSKRDAAMLFSNLPTDVDPVSGHYVRSVNTFGDGYEKWSDDFVDRLKAYAEKLEKIKKTYLSREEDVAGEMNKPLNT